MVQDSYNRFHLPLLHELSRINLLNLCIALYQELTLNTTLNSCMICTVQIVLVSCPCVCIHTSYFTALYGICWSVLKKLVHVTARLPWEILVIVGGTRELEKAHQMEEKQLIHLKAGMLFRQTSIIWWNGLTNLKQFSKCKSKTLHLEQINPMNHCRLRSTG